MYFVHECILYMNVYSSFTCNSPKSRTTKTSLYRWIVKQTVGMMKRKGQQLGWTSRVLSWVAKIVCTKISTPRSQSPYPTTPNCKHSRFSSLGFERQIDKKHHRWFQFCGSVWGVAVSKAMFLKYYHYYPTSTRHTHLSTHTHIPDVGLFMLWDSDLYWLIFKDER